MVSGCQSPCGFSTLRCPEEEMHRRCECWQCTSMDESSPAMPDDMATGDDGDARACDRSRLASSVHIVAGTRYRKHLSCRSIEVFLVA